MTDLEQLVRAIVRDELAKSGRFLAPLVSDGVRMPFRPRTLDGLDFLQPGILYAVCLIPEVRPFRIKVGFTNKSIADRVRSFTTTCPTAIAIGAWGAVLPDEQRVLARLPGRIGDSEVFVVDDIEVALSAIDALMESP